jgi:hypothetical protein
VAEKIEDFIGAIPDEWLDSSPSSNDIIANIKEAAADYEACCSETDWEALT